MLYLMEHLLDEHCTSIANLKWSVSNTTMTKNFLIAGSIVDTDAERETYEDVTPAQVNAFLNKLGPDDDVQLDITSYGGSVSAGIAICNLLKQASANGHKTIAHVIGIAASMASAIACACDELKIDANSFLMLHLPWTMTMGNAIDLRKEAEVLDKYKDALIAIYRKKFDMWDDGIEKMLAEETWILGDSASLFGLKAEVIPTAQPVRIAASLKMPKFKHLPKALKEIIMEKEEEEIKKVDDEVKNEEVVEEKVEETKAEEPVVEETQAEVVEETKAEELVVEETKAEEPKEEMVAKAEVDKRVSGMQSAMAKQMDAMKKDYEAKIADFEVQIKAKDEELTKTMALVTSLTDDLKNTSDELSKMTSAFKEKADALDALNASVNTPSQVDMKPWAKLHGEELLKWCRENQAYKH